MQNSDVGSLRCLSTEYRMAETVRNGQMCRRAVYICRLLIAVYLFTFHLYSLTNYPATKVVG